MQEIKIPIDLKTKQIGEIDCPDEITPVELAKILNACINSVLNALKAVKMETPGPRARIIKPDMVRSMAGRA
jgi:hypothetical protein